jgi:hypothetical protein
LTDDTRDRELRGFFQERILPAALALQARGVEFFALAPERTRRSYWNERPRGEGYVFRVSDDVAGDLHAMWRDYPEIQALAHELGEMTRVLADRREESADVSSFIYAMF